MQQINYLHLRIQRSINENIFIFLLQYVGTLLMITTPSFLWTASGTACGFIFLRGEGIVTGIWLGYFFAFFVLFKLILKASLLATILTLQPILILRMNYWFKNPTLIFYRMHLFLKYILTVMLLTLLTTLALFKICDQKQFLIFVEWWLANFLGTIIFSIGLVTWDIYFPEISQSRAIHLKNVLVVLLIVFAAVLLFFNFTPLLTLFISCLMLLVLIIQSMKYGWYHTVVLIVIEGLVCFFAAVLGFTISTPINLIIIQSTLLLSTLLGLALAILSYTNKVPNH